MTVKPPYLFVAALIFLLLNSVVYSQKLLDTDDMFEMDLDELLNIKILSGNISGLAQSDLPVSVTRISADKIDITPARNLYDLIEIYIPGAIWMNHHDSPHPGFRGIITDRNYKFLLLVNGRNMNMKARNGATSELENWDMGDIDEIEIIRGPGSVVYGPGAVAGVINIKTKSAGYSRGFKAGASYLSDYDSKGGRLSYGNYFGDLGVYLYASAFSTKGVDNIKAYAVQNNTSSGYIGSGNNSRPPQTYFADYNGFPQYKIHLELDYADNWKFWTRFVSAGMSQYGAFSKLQPQTGVDSAGMPELGNFVDIKQNFNKHFTSTLQFNKNFENGISLRSMLSYDTEHHARRMDWFRVFWGDDQPPEDVMDLLSDKNSIRNKYNDFAESQLLLKNTVKKQFSDISLAAGFEYSYNHWGPGWFRDKDEFRMGDKSNIISDENSKVFDENKPAGADWAGTIPSDAVFVGDGWGTHSGAVYGEMNWNIDDDYGMLLSGRIDKDEFSDYLFSPRASFLYRMNQRNVFRLSLQQSQRMNTAEELLLQNLAGNVSSPETLNGLELMYFSVPMKNLQLNSSVFYYNMEYLSWHDQTRSTRLTGVLKMAGIEFTAEYLIKTLMIGINHSFVKQIDWDLADGVDMSGVSYSDYYLSVNGNILKGTGNDLNNWPNHSTKIYVNWRLIENTLLLHLDGRSFWNFEGSRDGLKIIEDAAGSYPENDPVHEMITAWEAKHVYDIDFRLNFSLNYYILDNIKAGFYVLNLISTGENKRYTYDAGNKAEDYLLRTGFVEEPRAYGISFEYYLQ